jgi:hypothetical protein
MTADLSEWTTAEIIVEMSKCDLGIYKPNKELIDAEVKIIMHHIGVCATELYCIDGYDSRISLFGVGIMISVCIQTFPDYYERYELSQVN